MPLIGHKFSITVDYEVARLMEDGEVFMGKRIDNSRQNLFLCKPSDPMMPEIIGCFDPLEAERLKLPA